MNDTRRSYDRVAARYQAEVGPELAAKPLDRALLSAFAEQAHGVGGPVLDVGAGPGQVAAHLRGHGVAVVASDLSPAMCQLARGAGVPALVADMTALPVRAASVAGIVCFYAVIHLDRAQRAAAYAEFGRVLRPGGSALIAFHTSDAEMAMGDQKVFTSWWDEPVQLTFRYLDPAAEAAALVAAGFTVTARIDRAPGPGEHASNRSYLLVSRDQVAPSRG
jgi:SAM-dependent methyltransferase